jgi:hypothetical protein
VVTIADNNETAKAVVHHTIKRLSAGEPKNNLGTDLYSAFLATIEMNNQETNPHTMHSAKTVNQDSVVEPMSIPAITSRKEIKAASHYRELPAVPGENEANSIRSRVFCHIPRAGLTKARLGGRGQSESWQTPRERQ